MKKEPRGPQAAHLRQRKFQLLHRFPIPPDLLPGTLTRSFTRCGNPRCHCARDKGHEAWTLTFMVQSQRRTERIPRDWVEEVERRVAVGRAPPGPQRDVDVADAHGKRRVDRLEAPPAQRDVRIARLPVVLSSSNTSVPVMSDGIRSGVN